jgi:hypothetical protein
MGTVEKIEQAVSVLSKEDLAEFRAWFVAFDEATWDQKIERDAAAGKLDSLAERALQDHQAGRSTRL